MVVLQSQGSTPKVHEGDGWLCWLHVLPYQWIWLVSQRAARIWEEMFFGMKSINACTAIVENNNHTGKFGVWANAPVSQIFIWSCLFCMNLYHWLLYVGHLNFSRKTHQAEWNKSSSNIITDKKFWSWNMLVIWFCVRNMHIYCALDEMRITCQTAAISGALCSLPTKLDKLPPKPQETHHIGFFRITRSKERRLPASPRFVGYSC